MNEHEFLLLDVEDSIATITIDRPEKRNAMTFEMLNGFISLVREAGQRDDVRVVIVTGRPGVFCAGTDLAALGGATANLSADDEPQVRGEADEADVWWPLVSCPKPVIGAIDGPAVGMGAEFTSQCDVRIGTPNSRFAWNFAHRGLVPDTGAGSWLLPRLIGHQRALQLLYSGDFLSADDALAMGYLAEVVAADDLQRRAREIAEGFLVGSPFSHRRMKQLVYEGLARDVGDHMEAHVAALKECFSSNDHKEGVASFLEKRPATFTGT
ncbi:MAG: enoyl-CoA hydratase/isomerase family protein [Ilumatobacter sp.]